MVRYYPSFARGLFFVIAGLELASLMTFQLLGVTQFPAPWSLLIVLSHHFYLETVISLSLVMLLALSLWGYFKGGISRCITGFILGGFLFLIATLALGLGIYCWVEELASLPLTQILMLFRRLDDHSLTSMHALQSFLGAFVLTGILLSVFLFERFRPANRVLGNAHFANGLEVYRADFFTQQEESVIVGKKYGVPLYSNGFEHVLVFAPSGSGKTRSISIPNLFHFPYSVVCNDVKFTLFETTSGYRTNVLGHTCYCFAPTRKTGITHRLNPLDLISRNHLERLTDIQQIAHIFMPDNPKEQPIWTQASRKLFKTLALYLLDCGNRPITLGEINRLVKQEQFDAWLQEILDTTEHFDPEFYRNGYSYLNNHEKTRQGIVETFSGYFELFDDPFVDAATSASDFDFRELRRQKMTIYIGFSDEDMERLAPLLTLFWQQLITSMIKEIPSLDKEPYPLLCLIDEFSSLGRIERLRRSLKLLREYRVRCILMFQYIAQTYEKYSHDEAKAFTNIKTKISYTTEDIQDAEFISKMLGTRTKKVVSRSISHQQQGVSESKSIGYQAIPLMRPDAIMTMSSKKTLILRSGFAPVKAEQFIWYQEKVMKNLVDSSISLPQLNITLRPFIRQSQLESTAVKCID